jgi:hypothetical protein
MYTCVFLPLSLSTAGSFLPLLPPPRALFFLVSLPPSPTVSFGPVMSVRPDHLCKPPSHPAPTRVELHSYIVRTLVLSPYPNPQGANGIGRRPPDGTAGWWHIQRRMAAAGSRKKYSGPPVGARPESMCARMHPVSARPPQRS